MERYDLMGTPTASSEKAGVLRIASEVDEKNCGCEDAAVTPKNLYNLLDCRKANTSYKAGDVVACPYHTEFLLKCVTAGSTATGNLDTTNVTKGQVITDGGAKWEVIAKAIIDASISGKNITFTFADGTTKVVTTQDTEKPADMTDYIVESYRNGEEWYEIYKSGKVRQGGIIASVGTSTTKTFLKSYKQNPVVLVTEVMDANTTNQTIIKTITTTNFIVHNDHTSSVTTSATWVAEGQGA